MKTDENYMRQEDTKELFDVIGYFGSWQRRIFFIAFISLMAHCWHVLAMLFLAPNIDHWCQRPTTYSNISTDQWKDLAIPRVQSKNDSGIYSSCLVYKNFTSHMKEENSTTACASWEYDNSFYTSTIIDEWDLVCENDWLPSMSTSLYMGGFMTSVFISGQLSDRYGRRPIILFGGIIFLASGFACAFSTSFLMFNILRFLVAFGASGTVLTIIILLLEVIGPEYRSILGICYQFGWALGYTILPGVAFLVKKWRHFQLIISVPWILLCSIWWFLPESPRWLLSHGKVKLAEKEIRNAARVNGKIVSNWQVIMAQLMTKEKQEEEMKRNRQATFLDLFKTPNMRKKSLNNFLFWFVNAFTYYGLSLHTNDMGGNPLINFFIAGTLEFPANIIGFILIKHVGRRISLMALMVVGGVACLLTVPVSDSKPFFLSLISLLLFRFWTIRCLLHIV
ncbi:solute carrier family 22 member 21-like isoform X1 [Limulus polyphemus]|uniref:Solute carrier family 22 member 21-like isoform X1 n=1 Tax=Limulus polyphemus TaxID=6850 RepID=A0ABM1T4J3_LIMPO|nr:solute carrier family 22 member 21-like isoform X1 [Limulus polyphemus]